MQRVSSNFTIFWKLALPAFWLVFFGSFTLASVFIDNENNPFFNTIEYRVGLSPFYIIGAVFFYFTFMKLKRVDFGKEKFMVSNYFKTYQYSYKDIAEIKENNYIIIKTVNIILKDKGSFGKKITFLPQSQFLMEFMRDNPHLFKDVFDL